MTEENATTEAPPVTEPVEPAEAKSPAAVNNAARFSFYIGMASILPVLGVFPGLVAIWFGVMGFKLEKEEPTKGGKGYALVGIMFGLCFTAIWILLAVSFYFASRIGPMDKAMMEGM